MASSYSVTFLPPCSALKDYLLMSQPDDQPDTIPTTFKDAMKIRNEVFGQEQGVPMEYEWDEDDPRSAHWVMYSTDDSKRTPIGTIRAVPFPHPPHPENGGRYFEVADETVPPPPSSKEPPPHIVDRATTFHDGREPYVKLGRISVLKKYRGKGLAKVLTMTALQWLRENPTYFDSSNLSIEPVNLVCVHAQESVAAAWAKWGFQLDKGMGVWWEAGIPHVGMFQRLEKI